MTGYKRSKKIKVMFMIDFLYGLSGGTENQLVKILKNLEKNKYDIYLVTLQETQWVRDNMRNLNCNIMAYNIEKLKNPINILVFIRLVKYIKKVKPDIVVTFFPLSNILGVIAAKFAKVDTIISTRRDYGLWLDKKSVYLLRFANIFVKGIVANSRKVKELTSVEEKLDSSKIHVIYNGVEVNNVNPYAAKRSLLKKELGIAPHSKVVGIVGNLRPMKKHRTFIKAAKQVSRIRNDVDFLIVGDGPLRKNIEALTAELGIEKQIHFVGRQENVLPFLSIFDIGVNCSSNEGLSNAIMEYMAYGVPCIAARAGGNSELIENGINGYTFSLDDDEELAELILSLLDDRESKREFASKSKDIILKQLTLDRMIREYDTYFTQMLAHG